MTSGASLPRRLASLLRPRASYVRPALVALATFALLAHCWLFRDFFVDDAAISFSYARTWAEGGGLVATPGAERVEGYSNFLWVVLLAAGIRVGIDVFVWSKLLGMALAAALGVGVAELSAAMRGERSVVDALPVLLCAAIPTVPYWCMSGLEGPLYLTLVVWTVTRLLVERREPGRRPLSAVFAAATSLTRPDGLVIVALAIATRLTFRWEWRRAAFWKRLGLWFGLLIGPMALHYAWRYGYYGFLLSNPAYVKLDKPFQLKEVWDTSSPGWGYLKFVSDRYQLHKLLWVAPLALLRWRGLLTRLIVAAAALGMAFFPIYSRGDWMGEGRFLVPVIPLMLVLVADGIERVFGWMQPRRVPWIGKVLQAAAVLGLLLHFKPTWQKITEQARKSYPVPTSWVEVRAREYKKLAEMLEVKEPSVLDGDFGATSYYAGMDIVDLGALGDVTLARYRKHPALEREYVYGERKPTFTRLCDFWVNTGLTQYPEFVDGYIPLPFKDTQRKGLSISRRAFVREGVDTRTPLHVFADGMALVGSKVDQASTTLLLLVTRDGIRVAPRLVEGGRQVIPDALGASMFAPRHWRKGEVIEVKNPRASTEAPSLCLGSDCVQLQQGEAGASVVALPAPNENLLRRALERGDLETSLAIAQRLGRSTSEIGELLERRAKRLTDTSRRFRDLRLALAASNELPAARRALEKLRRERRQTYRYRWVKRLEEAVRSFQLEPSEDRLRQVIALADAAGQPASSVAAHASTRLPVSDEPSRLMLARHYAAIGLPDQGAWLVKDMKLVEPGTAAMAQAVVLAAADEPLAQAIAQPWANTGTAVIDGVMLVKGTVSATRDGEVELELILRRTSAVKATAIPVMDRPSQLDRAVNEWSDSELYVHRVVVNLPEGKQQVGIGGSLVEVDVPRFSTSFETGSMVGWARDGVFAAQPVRYGGREDVHGFEGERYVNTREAANVVATGEAKSPSLAPAVREVCALFGGTRSADAGFSLEVDGKPGPSATSTDEGWFKEKCLIVPAEAKEARIVLFDKTPGAFLLVDDLDCIADGRPLSCVK